MGHSFVGNLVQLLSTILIVVVTRITAKQENRLTFEYSYESDFYEIMILDTQDIGVLLINCMCG